MKYEIWREGYQITGNRDKARLLGVADGETFLDAVKAWYDTLTPEQKKDIDLDSDPPKDWGCCMYDNEADARKFLG